jgi:hypothetical protein
MTGAAASRLVGEAGTKDEFDLRVGRALASRICTELAALTLT